MDGPPVTPPESVGPPSIPAKPPGMPDNAAALSAAAAPGPAADAAPNDAAIHPAAAQGWMHCRLGEFDLRLDWRLAGGQVLVLFGPSGAGKTTALRAIAGLVRPLDGYIEIGGRAVYDGGAGLWVPAHRRRVGYLTQQYHLFPHLDVAANVGYGLPSGRAAAAETRRLLAAFGLDELAGRRTWELSGGQQQRVALARALAAGPQLLLLDEPFAALDLELRRTVRRELRATLSQAQAPVILVTHDREEALALGDEVKVLQDGQVTAAGLPVETLGQPGRAGVARLVGVENLLPMRVDSSNPRDGTMRCSGGGLQLEIPLSDTAVPGAAVTVAIRASDIILAGAEPVGSSARNRIPGTVRRIDARAPGYNIELACGGGPESGRLSEGDGAVLHCQVTGAALEEMGLRPGQRLWAVFKASSCFLVE